MFTESLITFRISSSGSSSGLSCIFHPISSVFCSTVPSIPATSGNASAQNCTPVSYPPTANGAVRINNSGNNIPLSVFINILFNFTHLYNSVVLSGIITTAVLCCLFHLSQQGILLTAENVFSLTPNIFSPGDAAKTSVTFVPGIVINISSSAFAQKT